MLPLIPVGFEVLAPLCSRLWAEALDELDSATIKRGWDLSRMGAAFELALQGKESAEFKEATALNAKAFILYSHNTYDCT